MNEKKCISIIPLGCPKNDVDSELIAGAFKDAGYNIEWNALKGEAVIINTCGFIKDAIDESLDAIMSSILAKKQGQVKKVIVTGCLAQRFGKQLTSKLKDVDLFLGVNGFESLPSLINNSNVQTLISDTPFTAYPEKHRRVPLKGNHSVYVKIADGCNNRCSYCVIPFIKGGLKSRSIQNILEEARALVDNGAVEVNLIAQDTLNFGIDRGKNQFIELLSGLEKIDGIKWIRLNYLYPSHLTDDIISFIADSDKIVKYFDIPIQHISDRILRLMNRKTTSKDIRQLIETLHKKIKDPFLRTTVIVGFPGESEQDFDLLLKFFDEYPFHRIGVFQYSKEEPAPASRLKNQVSKDTVVKRFNQLSEFSNELMHSLSSRFIDKTYDAIMDGTDPDDPSILLLRTWFLAPEIDGYVMVYPDSSGQKAVTGNGYAVLNPSNNKINLKAGVFKKVRITDAIGADFVGEVI
ncbi:MAG: 30S ribosomal protein S12 methylthiotransferase RimO [bacterium]